MEREGKERKGKERNKGATSYEGSKRCVCNIDCSQTNFNPLCASDGRSYDNACQIKEASCQKQEKIEVMSLGRCQDNTTATTKSEDGHYARTDYAENANKLEESARGIYIPCPEHYNGFCMHGKCEHSANMLEPSCRCDAGYTGQHCEKKDYSVLYVVPGPVRFQYVLIAAVIGTIQIAIICVVVLCITRLVTVSGEMSQEQQNSPAKAKHRALQFRQHNESIDQVNLKKSACFHNGKSKLQRAWTYKIQYYRQKFYTCCLAFVVIDTNENRTKHVLQLYLIMYGYI
ncbi:Tomoregulin-2, partial [Ophiophagus hannah]